MSDRLLSRLIFVGLICWGVVFGACATVPREAPAEVDPAQVEAHDQAVRLLREAPGEEAEERAVAVFEEACGEGLEAACTNLAYMLAAGRGTVRDHRRAGELFLEQCDRPGQEGEGFGAAGDGADEEVYLSTQYHPQVACAQLEVLARGSFEERLIAAVEAEREGLRRCFEEARPAGEERVGRLMLRAEVSVDGGGGRPEVVSDSLGLEAVAQCVERAMARHLDDGGEDGRFESRWGISFVHPPLVPSEEREGAEEAEIGCETESVRQALGGIYEDLQICGELHLAAEPQDPGAVFARWKMSPAGVVESLQMVTTIESPELLRCLEGAINTMQIDEFEEGTCPVQVPFVFSEGRDLHFGVISRRQP